MGAVRRLRKTPFCTLRLDASAVGLLRVLISSESKMGASEIFLVKNLIGFLQTTGDAPKSTANEAWVLVLKAEC